MKYIMQQPLLRSLAAACVCANLLTTPARAADKLVPIYREETKANKDARMAWFREARFGMFIHWGLYCVPGGIYHGEDVSKNNRYGEWIMNDCKIPIAEYAAFAPQFNPVKFNADEWVKVAKDAGMKYIVITAKHHEGFAMFKSQASAFNIYDATPFKRDPIKELAVACRQQGIKLGLYYSQNLDWHHIGGGVRPSEWDPTHKGDSEKYINEIVIPQVKEILTNYGEIPIIWWDIPGGVITKERAERIYKTVLACNPNIIMNNRLGGGYMGDTETPEQHIPAQGYPGRDWETCMTINATWGFKANDTHFKTTARLLQNLIDIASKGGNYLLNVGPSPEGIIPAGEVERIAAVGKWLQANGEAIYGTSATIFGDECAPVPTGRDDKDGKPILKEARIWRCTVRPGKVYIHLLAYPGTTALDGEARPIMVKREEAKNPPNFTFTLDTKGQLGAVTKAYMLADSNKTPLTVTIDGGKLTVTLPEKAPDPIASVLVLETAAK